MLEITADDIACLDDEKLRALVARLCEAELRARGFSPSCVTWGGDQNAPDAGIDVRVALPAGSTIEGFIPRPPSGFQVKKQDMPRAAILKEMQPGGILRPTIQELATNSGAYIIVSSEGSTADAALRRRRKAMREAIAGAQNDASLLVDFYDRTRIATWVRNHEGLIPWVRSLVGRPIAGWQSYGAWAYAESAVTAEYLLDDKLRVHPAGHNVAAGLAVLDGIRQLRDELRDERRVVRLVGLSGVGKTRLVQALFDNRVGEHALNPNLALYTNIADTPEPPPIRLATDLIAKGSRAILVVDNCSAELHQRLSELCRDERSRLSVITIEYDIREDVSEGTAVFALETSSNDLIEKLLAKRCLTLSQVDVRTIAEASGGNARVAIVLAGTVNANETVAGLSDEQLFQRLFLQRHEHDAGLYAAAQVCALVYSFHGEDIGSADSAELARLGRLIGMTPQQVYQHVAELQRRDVVQQRGVWRAVLPHAIANRLAGLALQNIPKSAIEAELLGGERLMLSFTRRLGYLHGSKEAVGIAKGCVHPEGLLADIPRLGTTGKAMLENIAPAIPEEMVAAFERVLKLPDGDEGATTCGDYLRLLRSLSYDAPLFERCAPLMAMILSAGKEEVAEHAHPTEVFTSLFHLFLSGTQAIIEQRLSAIRALLDAPEARRRALGVLALKAALEAWDFVGAATFEFGAHSRDFGYWPRTMQEVQHWFRETLHIVKAYTTTNTPVASEIRRVLADQFRALWLKGGVPDELAATCDALRVQGFWPEGWRAVRQTLEHDGNDLAPERRAALSRIEHGLRPVALAHKVRAAVFSTHFDDWDFEDIDHDETRNGESRVARSKTLAYDLGKAVACDPNAFSELLSELVRTEGLLFVFGQGLFDAAPKPSLLWQELVLALGITAHAQRRPEILGGYVCALRRRNTAESHAVLDDAIEHPVLAECYPYLQTCVALDTGDVARLKRSLVAGKAPAHRYMALAYGRATDLIAPQDLRDLTLGIASMPAGFDVAVEVLHMRLHADRDRPDGFAPELTAAGTELLLRQVFTKGNQREDYRVGQLAEQCLSGAMGAIAARKIARQLRDAVAKHETYAFYHDDLVAGLMSAQPIPALDGLCGGTTTDLELGVRILRDVRQRKDPLSFVPDEALLAWCGGSPEERYVALADVLPIARHNPEKGVVAWTGIARRFLQEAPSPDAVLEAFVSQFLSSGGWSKSLAGTMEQHAALLDELKDIPNLAPAVSEQKQRVADAIAFFRREENAADRQRDERFEW